MLNSVAREVTSVVKLKLALPLVSLSGAGLGEGSVAELPEEDAGSTTRFVSSPGNKVSCNSDP